MNANEIAEILVAGHAQQAAIETVNSGISADEVIVAYYYTVDPDTPEDYVQDMIDWYTGFVSQELKQLST